MTAFSENGSRLTFSSPFDLNRFLSNSMGHPVTLKDSMSAQDGPNCKFDPALDASDSRLCSARRINVVGQSYDLVTKHFWKVHQSIKMVSKSIKNCQYADLWDIIFFMKRRFSNNIGNIVPSDRNGFVWERFCLVFKTFRQTWKKPLRFLVST